MHRVYVYKLTSEGGGAPCVRNGILSLAICKPAIRSVAEHDSIVLGFAGNDLYNDNCLIYAARITKNLDGRKYFSEPGYSARPDCIYGWDGRRFEWKADAAFHSSSIVHDLGEPPLYGRADQERHNV